MKDESKQSIQYNKKEATKNDLAMRRFLSRFKEQDVIQIRSKKPTYIKPGQEHEYHGYNTPEYVSTLVKNLYV